MSDDLADRIDAKRKEIEATGLCQWGYRIPHDFVPSYSDPKKCGVIVEGHTWTVADPYYCGKPREAHLEKDFAGPWWFFGGRLLVWIEKTWPFVMVRRGRRR